MSSTKPVILDECTRKNRFNSNDVINFGGTCAFRHYSEYMNMDFHIYFPRTIAADLVNTKNGEVFVFEKDFQPSFGFTDPGDEASHPFMITSFCKRLDEKNSFYLVLDGDTLMELNP